MSRSESARNYSGEIRTMTDSNDSGNRSFTLKTNKSQRDIRNKIVIGESSEVL